MNSSRTNLLAAAEALTEDLTGLRHRLHAHPETGLDLPDTQRTLLNELTGLGLEITTGTCCSSITAVLRGGPVRAGDRSPRPVVLLRADMDALPVTERAEVPFRSRVDGVMHACGHDLHMTMLVGAARVLAAHREQLHGDVIFMFQPGEEGFDGAERMIADGVLEAAGGRPVAALALHVLSNLDPRFAVVSRPGPLMAASHALTVTVRGQGGHAAAPWTARDPIPAACRMVLALQTAMSERADPDRSTVLTVGSLHAGSRRNVIPETATFEATVRSFDSRVGEQIRDLAERVCLEVGRAHDVQVEIAFVPEYPVTVNDPAETLFALASAGSVVGSDRVLQLPEPITGSEDFSRILAEIPGAMLLLGAMPEDAGHEPVPANHSPRATFDDAVLPTGAALLATWARDRLAVPETTRPPVPRPAPGFLGAPTRSTPHGDQ